MINELIPNIEDRLNFIEKYEICLNVGRSQITPLSQPPIFGCLRV